MRELVDTRLSEIEVLSADISTFLLAALDRPFAGCEAGSHVDVHLGEGLVRSYSLIEWAPDGAWVRIGVKREDAGRGGSAAVHALELGAELRVAQPRNNFALHDGDEPVVLIGGGIGITPLLAMARTLRADGRDVELLYLVRTRSMAAFEKEVARLELDRPWTLHCDDRDGLFPFDALLADRSPETRYHVCGPEPMLSAVRAASEALGRGTVLFERFGADPAAAAVQHENDAFDVTLSSTGEEVHVAADTSLLAALRAAGQDVDYSCSEGACGSCILDVLEGEIDHRDSFLDDDERAAGDCLCICVSRARGPRLVLDL